MAEMYQVGDKDKNEKLELKEFIRGMMEHPVTSKIIRIKKIGKFFSQYLSLSIEVKKKGKVSPDVQSLVFVFC